MIVYSLRRNEAAIAAAAEPRVERQELQEMALAEAAGNGDIRTLKRLLAEAEATGL